MAMDDHLLMNGLKQKDRKAFNTLFDLLYPQLQFFTEQITKDKLEAEDISIYALSKFWEKGPNEFESFLQVRKFIFTVARNAAFDFLKKAKAHHAHHKNIMYMSETAEATQEDQALYKLETMLKALEIEIDKLPAQAREAFRLVFIEKIPRPEAAQRLNVTPGTLNVHCANALKKLRQIFSEKELFVLLLVISTIFNSKCTRSQVAGEMEQACMPEKNNSNFIITGGFEENHFCQDLRNVSLKAPNVRSFNFDKRI
jgi:RNA polymerase sigma-70 factor (ECF subfamily)